MADYKNKIEYNGKKLPDVFKELKEKQIRDYNHRLKIKYYKKISLVISCFIVIISFTSSIFAVQNETQINAKQLSNSENINTNEPSSLSNEDMIVLEKKETLVEEADVNFLTIYEENPNLPKGEEIIVQAGVLGKQEVTIERTYQNNKLVEENIINLNIYENSVQQIIEVGSSEVLQKLKIRIGDMAYTVDDCFLKETPNLNSNSIALIPQNFDVKVLETLEFWSKVEFENQIGYIENSILTSAFLDNEIAEKSRIKKLKFNVDINMNLNQVSGLTVEDYQKIFSNIKSDKNNIFEDNAVAFYNIEKKYNINGLFLASIAIHESGWGTSKIAREKKNLFGYGSYDGNAYQSSITFNTYEEGIDVVAKNLSKKYLNPSGTVICDGLIATGDYYNGSTVAGVNIRYASDNNWHIKVFNTMASLYDKL